MTNSTLLAEYHRRGDRTARDRVIEQNLPLVHAIARRFSRSPDQVDDLIQAGSIGLIKAVDDFDEDRGRDLGAYAVPTIVGELRRSAEERRWLVRVPRGRASVESPPVVVTLEESAREPSSAAELERSEERIVLHAGLRTLSRRERRIVVLRYYRDWSQQRIAEELGISQPQVSRALAAALRKMRVELTSQPEAEENCATRHTGLR